MADEVGATFLRAAGRGVTAFFWISSEALAS